jgi:Asp-tRNA(Asn)/Glu-tRNA(Gln) amidotransferase C subunit
MAQVIYPGTETASLREDEPRDTMNHELALRGAPATGAGHFKVPKVFER